MSSIYDIARIAGVSTATVSNVLNGRGRFSDATRERVLRIADEEGYLPNTNARSPRNVRTYTVGIVTPDVRNEYFSNIVLTIERAMFDHGYSSFICNTSYNEERAAAYIDNLRRRRIDGLFIVGKECVGNLPSIGDIPCALVDYYAPDRPSRYFLTQNDVDAMYVEQIKLLARRGCRRIGFILPNVSGIEHHPNFERLFRTSVAKACADFGVELDPDLILYMPPTRQESHDSVNAFIDAHTGAREKPIDGIAVVGDRTALSVVHALQRNGIEPGREVKVIGMDNTAASRYSSPAISTMDRNTEMMAYAATGAMVAMLKGKDPAEREVLIPYRIIERETTLGR